MNPGVLIPLVACGFGLACAYWTGRMRWAIGIPVVAGAVLSVIQAGGQPAWMTLILVVVGMPVAAAGAAGAFAGRWLRGRVAPTPFARKALAFAVLGVVTLAWLLVLAGPELDRDHARLSAGARQYAEADAAVVAQLGRLRSTRVTGSAKQRDSALPFVEITFQMLGERGNAFVTVNVEGSVDAPRYAMKAIVPLN